MPARGLRIQFTAIRTNARFKPTAQQELEIRQYALGFMAKLIIIVQEYPPEPQGTGYVRTYTLQRAWLKPSALREIKSGGALRYVVTNDARDSQVGYVTGGRVGETLGGETRYYTRSRGRYYARWVHGPTQEGAKRAQGWKNLGEELEKLGGRGKFAQGVQKVLDRGSSEFRTGG